MPLNAVRRLGSPPTVLRAARYSFARPFQLAPPPPACPYPSTAAQRAYADGAFRATVARSWLEGHQFQYNNSIYVPPSDVGVNVVALYQAIVTAPGMAGNPTPYLGQWIVGGSAEYPNWLWLAFPVQPGLDPYGAAAISMASQQWQKYAPLQSGQPLADVTNGANPGGGNPVVGTCGRWSH